MQTATASRPKAVTPPKGFIATQIAAKTSKPKTAVQSVAPTPAKVLDGEIVNRFDYTTITDAAVRIKVQKLTKEIHGSIRLERNAPFDIGKALIEAKAVKGFGHFDKWVAGEFQFSKRTAENQMALHRVFGDYRDHVSHVPLKALYKLASGKALKAVTAKVINAAKAGNPIAKSDVQRLIADASKASAKGKPALKVEDASTDETRMNAALSAVALLREKLDEDFPRFVQWFHGAGEAFAVALKEGA